MISWESDDELFTIARNELYTAVVGDICDKLGLRRQFLPPEIRAVAMPASNSLLVGRAMPVLEADVFHEFDSSKPFGKMLEALDSLERDEVYICAGASPRYALVGELMCTAMVTRGAVGAICDGFVRDIRGIQSLPLSVFALGSYAQDQRGRGTVIGYDVPIEIGGIGIRPGDIAIGDSDGVLIVPREHEKQIMREAIEKARSEKVVRKAILQGMSASEAFEKYGIL